MVVHSWLLLRLAQKSQPPGWLSRWARHIRRNRRLPSRPNSRLPTPPPVSANPPDPGRLAVLAPCSQNRCKLRSQSGVPGTRSDRRNLSALGGSPPRQYFLAVSGRSRLNTRPDAPLRLSTKVETESLGGYSTSRCTWSYAVTPHLCSGSPLPWMACPQRHIGQLRAFAYTTQNQTCFGAGPMGGWPHLHTAFSGVANP